MYTRTLFIYRCLIGMRCCILLLFVICTSAVATAQQFSAGVSFGVNASQISGDGYSGFNKAGISAGLFSTTRIDDKFDFQFEINYSEKGSRKNAKPSEDDNDFFLLRMPYVEIPFMIRYHKNKFTYEAGLSYSRLLSYYLENENGPFELEPQINQFSDNDFAFLLGINFNFTDNLIMNWRFNTSFLPFRKYDSGSNELPFDAGMYHHYIGFVMKYQFLGAYGK